MLDELVYPWLLVILPLLSEVAAVISSKIVTLLELSTPTQLKSELYDEPLRQIK